jgi:hypothetical protein
MQSDAAQADEVVLVIRPEPNGQDHHGADPMVRLRLLLKRMLRAYGWRCVRFEVASTRCPPYHRARAP